MKEVNMDPLAFGGGVPEPAQEPPAADPIEGAAFGGQTPQAQPKGPQQEFFASNDDYFGLPPGTLDYWKKNGHARSVNLDTNYFFQGLPPEDKQGYLYGIPSGKLRDMFTTWAPPEGIEKPKWSIWPDPAYQANPDQSGLPVVK